MRDGLSRKAVKTVIISLLLLLSISSGCLEVPLNPCEDDCFPLSSDSLNVILALSNSFDVLDLAETYPQLKVETTSITEIGGQRAEISWSVGKDDLAGLSSVALRYTIGTASVDTEVIEGKTTTNSRVGNVWFEGRDALPEYKDPFFDIARLASENPDGLWPPFAFDTTEISNLDWTITGDVVSQEQVATGSNSTHTIILVLSGAPPMITGIEMYGGDISQFSLSVTLGADAAITLGDELRRQPIQFIPEVNSWQAEGISTWSGDVPERISEVHPSELTLNARIGEGEDMISLASMNFEDRQTNVTLTDGTWWNFSWIDSRNDELVSGGDYWQVQTNSTAEVTIAVYDLWAGSWTDDYL